MKKLLVVIDMQNDFVTGVLGTNEAASIANSVAEYANNFDGDVALTRDTHHLNYLETQEGKNLPIVHCLENTNGWKIISDIQKQNYIFNKETFGSVDLANFIKDNKYETIEFIGVCTDICVISNVLLTKAFVPEAKIIVHKNLCAGVTPESHENAINAMKACQIIIED